MVLWWPRVHLQVCCSHLKCQRWKINKNWKKSFILTVHSAEKVLFLTTSYKLLSVVLSVAVKQPLDSQWQTAEASTAICQLSFLFIIPDLNVSVFPLQFHLDRLRLQVFALPFFFLKRNRINVLMPWFDFGVEITPPLLLFLCSQCGNWTTGPSQTGPSFVDTKRVRGVKASGHLSLRFYCPFSWWTKNYYIIYMFLSSKYQFFEAKNMAGSDLTEHSLKTVITSSAFYSGDLGWRFTDNQWTDR